MHHNANRVRITIQESAHYCQLFGYKYTKRTLLIDNRNLVKPETVPYSNFQATRFYYTPFTGAHSPFGNAFISFLCPLAW